MKKEIESGYLIGKIDELLDKVGCPICKLTVESVDDNIDALFYENVNDPSERKKFSSGPGFCPKHLKMVEDHLRAHPELGILGVSVLYGTISDEIIHALDGESINFGKNCQMCAVERGAERRYLDLFAQYISNEERLKRYENSISMVCLTHTNELLNRNTNFKRVQISKMERVINALKEFIRKNDYRYSKEPIFVMEGEAWRIISQFLS
ncbi:DUF6062 family protein [Athalassotoga saccharophila]|uniref:DUF6062 family protein n=1 Tax=Athalassotoga saccharophila TaxID=1441386 RepID=UPI001379C117|nr:DUF6062 family protein [Athalassotoga saccharophila]BBJ28008.1 hypothetical protein ATHSA_0908 [Athalassotoga saccharophila]